MITDEKTLELYLHSNMSEKRYIHSIGVAQTTEKIMNLYGVPIEKWNNFSSAVFCGLSHDLGREFSDNQIIEYCKKENIILSEENRQSPVLAHGIVSADIASKLCGSYPDSWKRAICIHTTGDSDMDGLALAVFIADYIEPSRIFMNDEKRKKYLSAKTIKGCARMILCDMIEHWKEKGYHDASKASLAMLEYLKDAK